MPQSAQEFTEITALIKGILNGYPGNSAIFREYLQNSDDAKASIQTFILDERSYSTASLVDPTLQRSQGPALIAVNDGLLQDADWKALRKIHSSSKKSDESQTGKNGLGFRASYHLTENPHIFSGRTLMILDPHQAFNEHPGGISIDVIDEGPEYEDQLTPFKCLIKDPFAFFEGTAFRLPLRTNEQAAVSQIKDTATTIDEIRTVFNDFATKDLEHVILFLKHITTIKLQHIDASGAEVSTITVSIDPLHTPCPSSHQRTVTVTSSDGTTTRHTWQFRHYSETKEAAKRVMEDRLGYHIGDSLTTEKLTPTIDMAMLIPFQLMRRRLFTLLPLPQFTNFPMHLNAVFALAPDRQSLKNIHEVGSSTSRERKLVEWNRAIFDTWTPVVWTDMLTDLPSSHLASASWSLWPPEESGEDCYWAGLATAMIKLVVSRKLAIFPTLPLESQTHLVRIDDPNVLLASPNTKAPLETLCQLGVRIVQPPSHIFAVLSSELPSSVISPQSLHKVLLRLPDAVIDRCGKENLHAIMEYLVFYSSPPNLSYITGLPWFYRADGHQDRVSLTLASQTILRYFIPSSEEETRVFARHTQMLSWGTVSDRLRNQLSLDSASQVLNVAVLTVEDIFSFLTDRFRFANYSDEIEVAPAEVDWMIRFWSWVSKHPTFFHGINKIADLYLLPTAKGTLRKLSSRIVFFANTDKSVVESWRTLGVFPLHPNMLADVISRLNTLSYVQLPRSSEYVSTIIKSCVLTPPNLSPRALLSAFRNIRVSLYDGLPLNNTLSLSIQDKQKLSLFQIFEVRAKCGEPSSLGNASGHRVYVYVDNHVPIPCLHKSEVYVDVRDSVTEAFLRLLDSGSPKVNKELDLMQLAVDHWSLQSTENQDLVVEHIFQNWYRLPPKLLADLTKLPFVTVNDKATRQPPKDLIHPKSILKALYIGEAGRMPAGRFLEDSYLAILQSLGFIRTALDEFIIQDRLQYFADTNSADAQLCKKAVSFVEVLNRHWKDAYLPLVRRSRDLRWLPVIESVDLVSPAQCRDNRRGNNSHPYLYDRALKVLKGEVSSEHFRSALGWSEMVPLNVLITQFILTLDLPESQERHERLIELLNCLGQLHHDAKISSFMVWLRNVTDGRDWVPVSSRSSQKTVGTKYALLSECNLKPPFYLIDNRLNRLEHIPLLLELGCTNRPSFEALTGQLNQTSLRLDAALTGQLNQKSLGLDAALAILHEIASYHHISDSNRDLIRIPGENLRFYSPDQIYFRDMEFPSLSVAISEKVAAHKVISKGLAESLGVPMLSSLTLGDDDDDEEQMSEDLVRRIRGFLRDYDPHYAFNEFLANADDAGATEFSMALKLEGSTTETVISPKFQSLFKHPSLVLFNNATLSDQDFAGIRRVGQGGKLDLADTHGRHGLGALSLYYFTDVVTIISGDFIMILDPSGSNLPPLRSGKRTALKKRISDIARQYPDQLTSYGSLFGFSPTDTTYQGTLFILPLSSTISEKACDYTITRGLINDTYQKLARQAFFFTRLERVSATELSRLQPRILWSMSARKSEVNTNSVGRHFSCHSVYVKFDAPAEEEERWIITTSENIEIPAEHHQTAIALKLMPNSTLKLELAVNVEKLKDKSLETFPFSTTSLPKPTSLPFHVNTRFAISSNRQGLVLNSADSRSQKDAKTAFNTWILDTVVPPLYLSSLEYLIHRLNHPLSNARWWLRNCPDDVSQIVRDGFFRTIAMADHRLFRSADKEWISFQDSIFSKQEPDQVRNILEAVQAPKFVLSHRDLSSLAAAKTVDPSFVADTLHRHASLTILQKLIFSNSIRREDIFTTLHYIREESPLTGLPLLFLSSGKLVAIPRISEPPVYISEKSTHRTLFASADFVQNEYSSVVLERLKNDDSVNVTPLTEERVLMLIKHELDIRTREQKIEWINIFWRHYNALPGPPSLDVLESSGLALIEGSSRDMSFKECFPDNVVYDAILSMTLPWLLLILQQMNIDIVKSGDNVVIRQFLSQRFPDLLENILKCIIKRGISLFEALPIGERKRLSRWITGELAGKVTTASWRQSPPIPKSQLMSLPIWDIYLSGAIQLHSASGVHVLPYHFQIQHLAAYLRPNVAIASSSTGLVDFMSYCMATPRSTHFARMTPEQILNAITLPDRVVDPGRVRELRVFVQAMLGFSDVDLRSITLRIPNGEGYLRPIGELYDNNVDLFSQSLSHAEGSSFVHREFQGLIPRLRELGLIHNINVNTFRVCAVAIQEVFGRTPNLPSLRDISTTAFETYRTILPPLIMTNRLSWASLDDIAFVLRKNERRQGASFHVERYFETSFPLIMPPSRFILSKFEPIAWTQRALFFSEPSESLLALHKSLGVPTAREVVDHLVILTTKIARDHRGDMTVLSDIKATYDWLNDSEHSEAAREDLLAVENEKIFLNVTDPVTENWDGNWASGKELVIYLHYDHGSMRYVRRFLQGYENLLLAAGCGTLKTFERKAMPQNPESDFDSLRELRKRFNEMRKVGELTDVILVPQIEEAEADLCEGDGKKRSEGNSGADDEHAIETEDGVVCRSQLRAHRVFLAATIPHLQEAQRWKENSNSEIPFFGTAFGAKSILDFVYTGELELSKPTLSPEVLGVLMRDLLELLPIADEWDMKDLKEKLQWEIIHKHDMIQRLPHEYDTMQSQAELYNAQKLLEALKEFKDQNGKIVQDLRDA